DNHPITTSKPYYFLSGLLEIQIMQYMDEIPCTENCSFQTFFLEGECAHTGKTLNGGKWHSGEGGVCVCVCVWGGGWCVCVCVCVGGGGVPVRGGRALTKNTIHLLRLC